MCIYSAFVTFVIVVVRVCRTSFDCFIKISAVQVLFQYVYILTSAGTIGYYNKCTCNVIILNPLCVKIYMKSSKCAILIHTEWLGIIDYHHELTNTMVP